MLSNEEQNRYQRQIILDQVGYVGQEKLKAASVLVIGAGGLGCPALTYLTAAGIGHIGIIDGDKVEVSNLHRQVLYNTGHLGQNKADAACAILHRQNPHIKITAYPNMLSVDNAIDICQQYDIILDGTDNFPTRYLVNDAAVLTDKPLVYGAIHKYEGQVSVFNLQDDEGRRGPNYRDLFPKPPAPGQVLSCAEIGVLGILPGIIGNFQALEVLKIVLGLPNVFSGKLLLYHALTGETRTLRIKSSNENPLTGLNPSQTSLIDYESFYGVRFDPKYEIAYSELIQLIESNNGVTVIDVRESNERRGTPLNSMHVPLSIFDEQIETVQLGKTVVFICRSGRRSMEAVSRFRAKFPSILVKSLKGGLLSLGEE